MENKFKSFFVKSNVLSEQECDLIDQYIDLEKGIDKSNNTYFVNLIIKKILPLNIFKKLLAFKNTCVYDFKFNLLGKVNDFSKEELNQYFVLFVNKLSNDPQIFNDIIKSNSLEVVDKTLKINYFHKFELDSLNYINYQILHSFQQAGFDINKIEFILDRNRQNIKLYIQNKTEKINSTIKSINTQSDNLTSYEAANIIKTKDITPIALINEELKSAVIEGYIFKIDVKPMKNGEKIFTFSISDNKNAIKISGFSFTNKFSNNKVVLNDAYLSSFKENDWIRAQCKFQENKYSNNEICGSIYKIHKIETPKQFIRDDKEETKRVELLMHSNMSAFDGIHDPEEIIKLSKKFNWNAISIVDRNNVHAFPNTFDNGRKLEQKIVYGVELNALNRNLIVLNPSIDADLKNMETVVFDIETTGLINEFEDLIEFGAIKIKDQKIIGRIDFFVKPSKPLNTFISQKTHITNEMLKDGCDIKTALNKIKDFIDNSVLIAHNGINFDYRFLNKKLEQNKMDLITNPIIDTMQVSRLVNKDMNQHNLGAISHKYRLQYNDLIAHRADFDAEILLSVWKHMLYLLHLENIHTLKELANANNDSLYSRQFVENFVILYPNSNESFNLLYKLVSYANTKYLYGSPRIFYDEINNVRDKFIVANHPIESSLYDAAYNGTMDDLKKHINYFDYIFVCSPNNLLHEINRGNLNLKQIQQIIKKIITTAISLNKKVIAVSDAYYLNPWDAIGREVFINSKLLNGRSHRIYSFSQSNDVLPDNHLRTTKEMLNEFSFLKDEKLIHEIVVDNSISFAKSLPNDLQPIKMKLYAPTVPGASENCKKLCYQRLKEIYGDDIHEEIKKRIDKELNSIIGNGFANIYWIASQLVKKSENDGYLVGSRGSVGSSFVAHLMGITEVNPLPPHYICPKCKNIIFNNAVNDGFDLPAKECPKCHTKMNSNGHNIPFETFLGFHGEKVPDIDLNFSGEYQAKAHNFIREMFGLDHTLRAGTIATIASKTAFGYVKTFYEKINPDNVPCSAQLDWAASKCINVKRTTGQHPGGIIVFPNEYSIFDFTPYNYPADDKSQYYSSHFDFNSLHDRLLKFDILGHDDPTKLKILKDMTKVDPLNIPLNDPKVLRLFSDITVLNIKPDDINGEITGVIGLPEFGTNFVRKILKTTLPKTVDDLISISGLSHGTDVWLNNAINLIKDSHLTLPEVVTSRDSIMTRLIQLGVDPQIAFSVMETVRKGKGIKPKDLEAIKQCNIPEWYINSCLKIKYLFPKAHATAYVITALRVAWYKIYYPLEFYATYFTIKPDVFDLDAAMHGKQAVINKMNDINKRLKSSEFKNTVKEKEMLTIYEVMLEMFVRGYSFKNIDLNKSNSTQFLVEDNKILPPFVSVDGLGTTIAKKICSSREQKPFISKEDLAKRSGMSTTILEKLDELGVTNNLQESNQISLFDL